MESESSILAQRRERLAQYINNVGKRNTPERLFVLEAAESLPPHFNAEQLCAAVAKNGNRLSLATIYNTLALLVECRILVRHNFFASSSVYELAPVRHHHLVCRSCGRIKDFRDTAFDNFMRGKRFTRFQPDGFSLTVFGICSTCARKAAKPVKNKNNNNHNIK